MNEHVWGKKIELSGQVVGFLCKNFKNCLGKNGKVSFHARQSNDFLKFSWEFNFWPDLLRLAVTDEGTWPWEYRDVTLRYCFITS